jgi:hypothetical protein
VTARPGLRRASDVTDAAADAEVHLTDRIAYDEVTPPAASA